MSDEKLREAARKALSVIEPYYEELRLELEKGSNVRAFGTWTNLGRVMVDLNAALNPEEA